MWISQLRISGVRCFEDTGEIELAAKCNIFVGRNNAGKSTILKAFLDWQGFPFAHEPQTDIRPGSDNCFHTMVVQDWLPANGLRQTPGHDPFRLLRLFRGAAPAYTGPQVLSFSDAQAFFPPRRPDHKIVPFLAKRKSAGFDQNVNRDAQTVINGTLSNLYSRIDLLATSGHPRHEDFRSAVLNVIGIPITTRASQNGKEAGFYLDEDNFVTLDRMGDGVSEMVALIVELCLERRKVFILEEPETNLHPQGLRALMGLVREAGERNQFIIATHSNIVVRELGAGADNRIFRVSRPNIDPRSPSIVEPVDASAHLQLLRELGYEFADLDLHDGWLFLEESSAESVIQQILIPFFFPRLQGRLRTYSAGGIDNLEPSVGEFQRLVVFVHLQPVYRDRLWVRADGDPAGRGVVGLMRERFPEFDAEHLASFNEAQFEFYYPRQFQDDARRIAALADKRARWQAKRELLQRVLGWTRDNPAEAHDAWAASAEEPIKLLAQIQEALA